MKIINRAGKVFFLSMALLSLSAVCFGSINDSPDEIMLFSPGSGTNDTNADLLVNNSAGAVSLGLGGELRVRYINKLIIDGPGNDLQITDAGSFSESYRVYLSSDGSTWEGPLNGTGTTSFDLASLTNLSSIRGIRYATAVRIVDSGTSTEDAPYKGVDVAGIHALNTRMPFFIKSIEFVSYGQICIDGTSTSPVPTPEYEITDRYLDPALGLDWAGSSGISPSQPGIFRTGTNPKFKVKFQTPTILSSATINSASLSNGLGTAAFGAAASDSTASLNFTGGESGEVLMTFSSQPTGVNAYLSALNISATAGSSSASLEIVKLRIYYVLEKATSALYSNLGWSRAYEFFCSTANGATNATDLRKNITTALFSSKWKTMALCYVGNNQSSFTYDPSSGHGYYINETPAQSSPSTGATATIRLSNFLTALGVSATTTPAQCNEIAGVVSSLFYMFGYPSQNLRLEDVAMRSAFTNSSPMVYIQPGNTSQDAAFLYLRTKSAYPAGSTSKLTYDFTFHQIATDGASSTSGSQTSAQFGYYPFTDVYDACVSQNIASASSSDMYFRQYIPAAFSLSDASRSSVLFVFPVTINNVN